VRLDRVTLFDRTGKVVKRKVHESTQSADAVDRGEYAHYMLKEIYEQPRAIADTLSSASPTATCSRRSSGRAPARSCAGEEHAHRRVRHELPRRPHRPLLLRAGHHIPCQVEVASGVSLRRPVVLRARCSSRSRSRRDRRHLAALHEAKKLGYVATLAICNVPESSAVRAADLTLMTRAGPEVGVASTKAFTTRSRRSGCSALRSRVITRCPRPAANYVRQLKHIPEMIEHTLKLEPKIRSGRSISPTRSTRCSWAAGELAGGDGRRAEAEGDLLHPRRAYPAGSSRRPLALVDATCRSWRWRRTTRCWRSSSPTQEVRARGGRLYVFADRWRHRPG